MAIATFAIAASSVNVASLITIRTGLAMPTAVKEGLTEYLCDAPGCPNIAVYPLRCSKNLCAVVVVCEEDARRATSDSNFQ